MMFRFDTSSATDVGLVRERNEDNYYNDPDNGVWVVADGMGGHDAGDVASQVIVDLMGTIGRPASADDLLGRVQHRLGKAHDRLKTYAREHRLPIVGAAVVVLLAYRRHMACIWSGDSRLYQVRDGAIRQVTRDHTELAELMDRGLVSEEEATRWTSRNVITHAVGVHDKLELEAVYGDIREGDVFVLCSDGLYLHVHDLEIATHVQSRRADAAAEALVALALARGGEDNVTVTIVRAEGTSGTVLVSATGPTR